jgi:hypothetical protein
MDRRPFPNARLQGILPFGHQWRLQVSFASDGWQDRREEGTTLTSAGITEARSITELLEGGLNASPIPNFVEKGPAVICSAMGKREC